MKMFGGDEQMVKTVKDELRTTPGRHRFNNDFPKVEKLEEFYVRKVTQDVDEEPARNPSDLSVVMPLRLIATGQVRPPDQ